MASSTNTSVLSAVQPLPNPRRTRTYAVLKSLVNSADSPDALGGQNEATGQIVINFPAMPDTIKLARQAHYQNSVQGPITPDGFHIYRYTEPLSIPISFSLSGLDADYCTPQYGPLMLLVIAAKLHALVMPITPGGNRVNTLSQAPAPDTTGGKGEIQANGTQLNGGVYAAPSNNKFFFPPPCQLSIMLAKGVGDGTGLGINCDGFITEVETTLRGPWLQGSFSDSTNYNLPSALDCSFTFVHQPGYTNNVLGSGFTGIYSSVNLVTTCAQDIYGRLYNTANIAPGGLLYADITGSTSAGSTTAITLKPAT